MFDPRDVGFVILIALVFAWGCIVGSVQRGREYRKEAVKAGVAHWVSDENGDTKFEFHK